MLTRRMLLATASVSLLQAERANPEKKIAIGAQSGAGANGRSGNLDSARASVVRCLGLLADKFHLSNIPADAGHSVYELQAVAGQVEVKASSPVAALRGIYSYLRENHLGMITWSGRRLQTSQALPDAPHRRVVCPYRFTQYFNPCTFGYSTPFWSWERWERELDWMALHGINMPLALDGQEAIWQRVWSSFGVTESEWNAFTTGPAHLPWHRMGNINRFDGPLPQTWIDRKLLLQKKILSRMAELGMTPIVPGFAGHVPEAFKRLYPQATISTLLWDTAPGFPRDSRTCLLSPYDRDLFAEVGSRFVKAYRDEYAVGGFYLADPFNELQVPVSEDHRYRDLKTFASNIYAGIQSADPQGVWVMQGWQYANDPKFWDKKSTEALLSGVPAGRLMIIDYASDMDSVHEVEYHDSPDAWKRLDSFYGKPWINGMAHTFGGNNNVKGNLALIATKPALTLSNEARGNLTGWGIDMEGIETNEVVYELLTDVGWSEAAIDLTSWIPSYCLARYGTYSAAMQEAWQLLLRSAYGDDVWKTRLALQSHPSLQPKALHVDTSSVFRQAVERFVSCAGDAGSSVLYRNDLIELVTQCVGGSVDQKLALACQSHLDNRPAERDLKAGQALSMMRRMDALLHLRPDRRLETWVGAARSWAKGPDEAAFYDSNARLIITYWGWQELEDYASRLWSGLVRDYYVARWEIFFNQLKSPKSPKVEQWTQSWLSTPYQPSKPLPVTDWIAEARRMLEDCKNWT